MLIGDHVAVRATFCKLACDAEPVILLIYGAVAIEHGYLNLSRQWNHSQSLFAEVRLTLTNTVFL